jgi:hypothetical protein
VRRGASKEIGWALAAAVALASGAARAEDGPSALDLLRSASVTATGEGLELTVILTEAELGEVGRAALDDYLRAKRPRLLSRISLGMVRYLNPRLVARRVAVTPRPRRANHLDFIVDAELQVDAQKRELHCELDAWPPSCESRWLDRGTAVLARVEASGVLSLSLRRGATLAGRPVEAEVSIHRVRGALVLGALADVDLGVDLDPPYRADRMALGLPASALRKRFAALELRRLRVAAAGSDRIAITALVGHAPSP